MLLYTSRYELYSTLRTKLCVICVDYSTTPYNRHFLCALFFLIYISPYIIAHYNIFVNNYFIALASTCVRNAAKAPFLTRDKKYKVNRVR